MSSPSRRSTSGRPPSSSEEAPGSFTPIFRNRQWFPRQKCQTLGLLCDPTHPALREFPTDFHSDWQWEDIVNRSRGVTCLPRQDMSNGRIARCEVYCSKALDGWGEPVAKANSPNSGELQTLRFETPVATRHLKLVALSEARGQPFTSIAELDVLLEPSPR